MNSTMTAKGVQDKSVARKSMLLLAFLFFIFGLVTWVNTILIPYFQLTLQLTNFQSYLVTFAFT